ncbi:MAG: hypothetical protein R3199_00105 [Gemmatimonadota bacterium]|nr:hypothetical protein [Gemmatimonadota bacterium]
MRTFAPILASLLALSLAACGGQGPETEPEETADDTLAAAEADTAGAAEADEEIPSREDEVARDEGSKPQQLFDFVGIERGDAVVDIFAGSGYNTYLLSERVGPGGTVYAQGYSPGLEARLERGDLSQAENVVLVDSLSRLPADSVDHAIIVRGYHLFEDPGTLFDALHRALVPGGTVGVVELRLGQPRGHDMETHRMGERTVIDQFTEAGFEYVGESDILRNPDDPHTSFWEGRRHLADRMLLKFAEPGEPAPEAPATARREG